jgi:hypothetical protein
LNTTPYHSNLYWPPHIEDWLIRHARDSSQNPFSGNWYADWDKSEHKNGVEPVHTIIGGSREIDAVMYGSKRVVVRDPWILEMGREVYYTTVEYMAKGGMNLLCVQDIKASPPNTWWLLPTVYMFTDPNRKWV